VSDIMMVPFTLKTGVTASS